MATLSGTVKNAAGGYIQRLVRAYHRGTGALVGSALSDPSTGAYSITTANNDEHFVVVHDSSAIDSTYFANVVLAMHMNDIGLTDSKGHAVTLNGNVARSATQSKFGGYSAYFDGTDDYLLVNGGSDFDLSSGNWTVETWLYRTTSGASQTILNLAAAAGANSGLNFWINSSNQLVQDNGVTGTTAAGTVPANQWTHVAACRNAGATQLFIDGTPVGSTIAQAPNTAAYAYIGITSFASTSDYTGYMDDLLITKGVAKYTGAFSVPTSPFSDGFSGGTENALIFDRVTPV